MSIFARKNAYLNVFYVALEFTFCFVLVKRIINCNTDVDRIYFTLRPNYIINIHFYVVYFE